MVEKKTGVLYIVATPIGNLDDISRRAIQILEEVDLIAAEDTRHSKKLLQHLGIEGGKMLACHEHSKSADIERLVVALQNGNDLALISDAGTPLISDPGFALVNRARELGVEVLPVPGASALTAALSISGLPGDRFVFEGFLPAKQAARLSRLRELETETRSMVFFEAPHRIADFLRDASKIFAANRMAFICRELTKKFEQHQRGDLASLISWLEDNADHQRGEFVIIIAGCSSLDNEQLRQQQALKLVAQLRRQLSLKQSVAEASEFTGARKNALYESALAREKDKDSGA